MLWNHGAGEERCWEDETEHVTASERREQGGREERQHEPNRQGKAWEVDGKTVARKLMENWIPPYLCDPEVYGLFLGSYSRHHPPYAEMAVQAVSSRVPHCPLDTQKVSFTHP